MVKLNTTLKLITGEIKMATSVQNQRKGMSAAELKKDKEAQQKRIDKNNETLKKADKLDTGPGSLGAAMKEFGAMGNKNLAESRDEAEKMRKEKELKDVNQHKWKGEMK